MHVLALDIGEKRVGIAHADTSFGIAMPLCVLPASEVFSHAVTFRRVLEDYEPELLLVGRPLTLSGEVGPQAGRVVSVAKQISRQCGIALEFMDERLSSAEAKRVLREQGMNEKQMRGKIDCVAASLFLQSWLDRRAGETMGDS